MDFELKEGANPVQSQPWPVTWVYEEILKIGWMSYENLGYWKKNDSKWGARSFSQPKPKSDKVIFLPNFSSLSKQLKRKPHPMVKIK